MTNKMKVEWKELKRKFICDTMKWHNGEGDKPHHHKDDPLKFLVFSICSRCGKSVQQDSQGNWF